MKVLYSHFRKNLKIYELLFFATLSIILVILFKNSRYFDSVEQFAQENLFIIFIVLTFAKVLAIIWPPFPASIFIIALIPAIGFWPAFMADYIGELVGSSAAYYIAYNYGYKGIALFLDEENIKRIQRIKVKKGKELEFLLILRVLGNTFFEIMCYGAGLLKISFKAFFISTILSYFAVSFITFKLFEGLFKEESFYINGALILFLAIFLTKFGSRYIQIGDSPSG